MLRYYERVYDQDKLGRNYSQSNWSFAKKKKTNKQTKSKQINTHSERSEMNDHQMITSNSHVLFKIKMGFNKYVIMLISL